MARHPYLDALIPLAGDAAADDISQAVETYTPLTVTSVEGITTRDLARTFVVLLISGGSYFVYRYDPDNTDEPDGVTVIHDSADRPFVRVGTTPGGGFAPKGEYAGATVHELLDLVTDQSASWVYLNGTPGSGNAPPALPLTSNTHWQLVAAPGAQGPAGENFEPDEVVALIAGRAAFDGEAKGFSVLVESDAGNGGEPTLYFKLSAASADWSGGFTFMGLSRADVFDWVDPVAGSEATNELTLDCLDGAKSYFEHTLAANSELQALANAPVGSTIELLIDPGANVFTFDTAAYEGTDDTLPSVTVETLLVIKVASGPRYLVHVAGESYGSGV